MRSFLLLLCIFFSNLSLQSQDTITNTVEKQRVDSLLALAKTYYKTHLDSAEYYLDLVQKDIDAIQDIEIKATSNIIRSDVLLQKKEYPLVINVLQYNLDFKEQISGLSLAKTFRGIGNSYRMQWVPDSAIVNMTRALRLSYQEGDLRMLSLCYLDLGLIYSKLENGEFADDFFEKSMQYSKNSEVMEMHKKHITNKSARPVSYDATLELAMDIAKLGEDQNDYKILVVAYSDIRSGLFTLKRYDEAMVYSEKELKIREERNYSSTIPVLKYDMGAISAAKGNYDTALNYYREALPLATDSLKLDLYQGMKEVFMAQGKTNLALNSLEDYNMVKDSLNKRNIQISIAELATKYQTELKEEQIKTLNAENELKSAKINKQRTAIFGTVGAGILLLFLGFLGYTNYKSRQELNYTQLNFRLLQTQMNPHFMFNALNEIGANSSESNANTAESLASYSKLMRNILESSAREFVSLQSDIDLITNFLKIQQLVQANSFDFSVDVAEELDTHYLEIPPMMTQPYVENAVIHGVKNISEGNIKVNYSLENDRVVVVIRDNGKGFVADSINSGNELHKSMGTDIIQKRMDAYQKLHKFEISTNLVSGEDKGTEITLTFPMKIKTI